MPGGMVGSSHTELSTSPGTVGICVVTSCCSQFDDGTAYLLTKKGKGEGKKDASVSQSSQSRCCKCCCGRLQSLHNDIHGRLHGVAFGGLPNGTL